MKTEDFNFYSILISSISLILAISIVYLTMWYAKTTKKIFESGNSNYELNRKTAITDIHSRFQNNMRDIQLKFPYTINDNNIPVSEQDKRHIQLYWYLVLDEYITCKKMTNDKDLNNLWDNMYFNGMKSALRLKSFYEEIAYLLSTNSTFLGHRNEFENEIKKANNGFIPTKENFSK